MPEYNVATCRIFIGYTCDINEHNEIHIIPASLAWDERQTM